MLRKVAISILLLAGLVSWCTAQNLGDAAREARKNKRASSSSSRVYTNESVSTGRPYAGSVSGTAEAAAETPSADKKSTDAESKKTEGSDAALEEDKKKTADELKTKLNDARSELGRLQRELDIMQRENRLRTAQFYADAGARLRDEKKYAEQERQNHTDLTAKQRAVADQQKIVDDLQEQARRLGTR
jgi:hypothetical protein